MVQKQADTTTADTTRLIHRKPQKTFQGNMGVSRVSPSNLACSNDGENADDENDDETEHGKLSEHGESGWVMGVSGSPRNSDNVTWEHSQICITYVT